MPTDQSPHYLIIQVCQGDMVVVVVVFFFWGGVTRDEICMDYPPFALPYVVSYSITVV